MEQPMPIAYRGWCIKHNHGRMGTGILGPTHGLIIMGFFDGICGSGWIKGVAG